MKKKLIKYFKNLGIDVYTNTKARGHQGFFLKNRIDISKNITEERIIPTLLHEFAHFIHNKLEPEMVKTGGSLELLFCFEIKKQEIEKELYAITNFVDENSLNKKLFEHKNIIKNKIKKLDDEIKKDYPNFSRSKKFKEFEKYIKKSKAKYLLKYDRVKFITPFLRREEFFSLDKIEKDFPDMPQAFCAYLRLRSAQRKQGRISARINHLNKYYLKPSELFARFVEGMYLNKEKTQKLAPQSSIIFNKLLENGYYLELKNVFELLQEKEILTNF